VTIGVKICGIRTLPDLDAAIAAGASHCGLVFFPPSPRNLSLQDAANLASHGRGRVTIVALIVDAADDLIRAIADEVAPDMLQLHGKESPQRTAQIREMAGRPVMKAVSVARKADVLAADAYRGAADLILFDAKPPRRHKGALPGGNGLSFNWRFLQPIRGRMPFALSGGLTPDNVADAVAATGAALVDVSSGVESAPGAKNAELIRRFVTAAKTPILEGAAHG